MTSPRLFSTGTVAVTAGQKRVTLTGALVAEINFTDGDDLQVLGNGSCLAIDALLPDTNQFDLLHAFDGTTDEAAVYTIYRNPAGWGSQRKLSSDLSEAVRTKIDNVPFTAEQLEAADAAAATAVEKAGEAAAGAGTATSQAGIATAKASQTAADRTQTGLDRTATAGFATSAMLARDASFALGPKYADEASGRSAVADGAAFLVQGSGGVAAFEYRRISSSVSTLIATYPAAGAVDDLNTRETLGFLQPNLVPDQLNLVQSNLDFAQQTIVPQPAMYNGQPCWSLTVEGTGANSLYIRLARALFGTHVAGSLRILGVTATGAGSTSAITRAMLRQMNGASEIGGTRKEKVFITGTSAGAVTEPLPRFEGWAEIHASCTHIDLFADCQNTSGATSRVIYFTDLLLVDGRNTAFRLSAPGRAAAQNRLPNDDWSVMTGPNSGAVIPIAVEDGFAVISLPNGTTPYVSYDLPATGLLAPGKTVQILAECNTDGAVSTLRADLLFFNASNVEISAARLQAPNQAASGWQVLRKSGVVPAGAVTLRVRFARFSASGTSWKFRRPCLVSGSDQKLLRDNVLTVNTTGILDTRRHIAPAGNDANAGSSSAPMATLQAAFNAGATTVVVQDGEYTAAELTLNMATLSGSLAIVAAPDAFPFAKGGVDVSGFTPTAGRTDVYEAACPTQPALYHVSSPAGFVFLPDTPFSAIAAADRHPAHRGRSHRLPHTPFFPKASLNDLEAASKSADRPTYWFYDPASGGKIYVRSVAGVTVGTMAIKVPSGVAIEGGHPGVRLRVVGIDWHFMDLVFDDIAQVELVRLASYGAPTEGLSLDRTDSVDRFCTVAGSSNDNWNLHSTNGDTPGRTDGYASVETTNVSIEPYSAWAFDDGRSAHERCAEQVNGGLFEFCGSTGVAPAQGAESSLNHIEVRSCGWDQPDQAGVHLQNTNVDDGTGTLCICNGVTVRDMRVGFACWGGSEQKLLLRDTRTVNCSVAVVQAAADTTIEISRHFDSGSAALKTGPGTITVSNGTLVT